MTEKPILFSGPMVRALLGGTKTQTRRVCKNKVYGNGFVFDGRELLCHNDYLPPSALLMDYRAGGHDLTTSDLEGWGEACPHGQPGDHLWVKETFFAWGRWETRFSAKKGRDEWHFVDMTLEGGHQYAYPADGRTIAPHRRSGGVSPTWWKRPAIFMPRAASRITLDVTDVRVERLQDISEADALAEGVNVHPDHHGKPRTSIYSPVQAYADLWDEINGAGSWEANPWVWAVSFRRITP